MSKTTLVPTHKIRAMFSCAMSGMYRKEVPAYGTLIDLVGNVNKGILGGNSILHKSLALSGGLMRLKDERHGAIRLGKASELAMMRRIFSIMGMHPVGYYDLSAAGIPVHSTAFRPITMSELEKNPFRIFTSLLRLELIKDKSLREEASATLERRDIFTTGVYALVEKAEKEGGLDDHDAWQFVAEVLETFRWHDKAAVSEQLYKRLHETHRLIADVVCFKGPHINHLTPCTLDIDQVQSQMLEKGMDPKAIVEGPPARACPILLRQTSFKALNETVSFPADNSAYLKGSHTARFGEIEQRGCALTPKGRALYDNLLLEARRCVTPDANGNNADIYMEALQAKFVDFPDTHEELQKQQLAYYHYSLTEKGNATRINGSISVDELVAAGLIEYAPIIYEDFLPVSAAGIFQSNLGGDATQEIVELPNKALFEAALGAKIVDEFELYETMEKLSLETCFMALGAKERAA